MNKTYIANENHQYLKVGVEVDEEGVAIDWFGMTVVKPVNKPDWYDEVKWKPKEGEEYYYVRDCEFNKDLVVRRTEWECTDWDERKYRIGNCYKTREEAGQALERVLKAYKGK